MTPKEIAAAIMADATVFAARWENIRKEVQLFLREVMLKVKSTTGQIPDEATFLQVVKELLDAQIKLPDVLEGLDDIVINGILKLADKYLLDKMFGEGWYSKLVEWVNTLEANK